MSKKGFINSSIVVKNRVMEYCRIEVNLFCEIMEWSKEDVYFVGDDPHGVVSLGDYFFNMSDIHEVIANYEKHIERFGSNEELRKSVDAWYYYCIGWHNQHSYEEPRWVSVKERLPDTEGAEYPYSQSVHVSDGKVVLRSCYNYEKDMWIGVAGNGITHWKPIITPEQEAERSKGCPNLRSWLAGCPVDGLRDATPEWKEEQRKSQEAARQRVEECKQALEDAIKEEVKLNKF